MRCQLSSLAANGWIAEEPERWDRTSACKGALLQPLQSMFWSHPPRSPWHRPWHDADHDVGAYVPYSCRTMSRVLLRLLPTEVQGWRRQGHRLWTKKGVSQLAWSHQFFTDLGWWSGRGLNSRPPGQQTGALATELTGRHWKCFLGPVYMEVGDTISHFNLITLYMIGGVTRHMLPHLSTGHGVFHLQVNRPLGYPEYSWISSGAINLYLFGQGNLRLLEITRASVLFSRTFYMLLNVFKSEHFSVFLSHHIFESENFRISFF